MEELLYYAILAVVIVPFSVESSSFARRGSCDPIVPQYCALPMPNSFFTKSDESTDTGVSVSFDSRSLPLDIFSRGITPSQWNTFDGFSPYPSIVTYFDEVDSSNLPPHWDITQSLLPSSPTILYNLKTGARVPHFSELDVSFNVSNEKALMIWPAVRLNDSTEYIVAVKNLRHTNGTLVSPSKAFRALRDSISTNDTDIEYRRSKYNKYITILGTAGIITSRSELQIMWDFNTASTGCITKRLLHMRDDSFKRVNSLEGPSYVISDVTDNYSTNTYRHILGVMTVPLYMNSPLPGAHLVTDERGLPTFQMNASATFTLLIPHSLANGSISTARIVQYGHGLFSSETEVETDYLQEQANRYGYILASCDLWGMTQYDVPSLVLTIVKNISDFRILPDRLSQGVINQLLLMKALKGALHKDPIVTINNKISIDPSHAHFYGVSLGGVMGQVYMALSQDVTRGVLGVPGGPFGLLLPRSYDFRQFEDILRVLYPRPVDYVTIVSFMNTMWSIKCGPGGYMNSISGSLLPNTPTHRVIYQYGLGDAQVNVLGLYSSARSNQAKMFQSNVKETFILANGKVLAEKLFGFQFVPDDSVVTMGSVAMGYDCHAPPEPAGNVPPNANTDVHELPRRTLSAQEQMYIFFKSGEIRNTCIGGGACVHDCKI